MSALLVAVLVGFGCLSQRNCDGRVKIEVHIVALVIFVVLVITIGWLLLRWVRLVGVSAMSHQLLESFTDVLVIDDILLDDVDEVVDILVKGGWSLLYVLAAWMTMERLEWMVSTMMHWSRYSDLKSKRRKAVHVLVVVSIGPSLR